MRLLAIDPGSTESGWVLIDTADCRPIEFGKTENSELRDDMLFGARSLDQVEATCIEMIASYGMAVGREVFETCVWIGRFDECRPPASTPAQLVYRRDVKLHLCRSSKAKDANVRQALVDRFTPGARNHGKGTKAAPGWFYGFYKDIWQAYALAVTYADKLEGRQP